MKNKFCSKRYPVNNNTVSLCDTFNKLTNMELEPIKAYEHLLAIREEERLVTELVSDADIESTEKILPHRNSGISPSSLGGNETKALATGGTTALDFTSTLNWSTKVSHPVNTTADSYDYDDDKNTLTGDEITSIRKSSVGETLADLEYYPISPLPIWNSEDELELLVNDCQERLEQLRENTDETGKLNDETLVRLLIQKLMSKPCQNQGYVLDGFPKTLEQAEALFRPDPEDEDILGNEKFPSSHRLITPDYVIYLMGSNELVRHRFNRQSTEAGLNPEQALVIPPLWKACLLGDKYMSQDADKMKPSVNVENEPEKGSEHLENTDENAPGEEMTVLKHLETQKHRHERRLEAYRAAMAPAAAAFRAALIDEANLLHEEKKEERRELRKAQKELLRVLAAEEATVEDGIDGGGGQERDDEHEKTKEGVNDALPSEKAKEEGERDSEKGEDVGEEEEHTKTESTLEELRLAHIPPIPETPDDTEENVMTYFDIREIHPVVIDMDKDFSSVIGTNGPQEDCFEKVRKVIGRQEAPNLPSIKLLSSKPSECEMQQRAMKNLKELQAVKMKLSESRMERDEKEEAKLLQQYQDDWNRWLSLLNAQNYQYTEAHSLPMRHYLMKYIMPDLSKALLKCTEVRPEDPVDFVVS
ncbi:unnamed protein product [Trichobilharzia szidati]|nr:unnamed protein product [Trichobilharzia szidati]